MGKYIIKGMPLMHNRKRHEIGSVIELEAHEAEAISAYLEPIDQEDGNNDDKMAAVQSPAGKTVPDQYGTAGQDTLQPVAGAPTEPDTMDTVPEAANDTAGDAFGGESAPADQPGTEPLAEEPAPAGKGTDKKSSNRSGKKAE